MVTADDFGGLRLFNAPCVVEDAPSHLATGHCSHLSTARFLRGDSLVVSGGGKDRTMMLWRLVPAPPPDPLRPGAPPPPSRAWRPQGRGNAAAWKGLGAQALLHDQRPRELY